MRPMNAFADAMAHAQTVRQYMTQAVLGLNASHANVDDATAALHKARIAWMEVVFSIGKAGQSAPPAPAALNDGFMRHRPTDERSVLAKREALALDLTEVDRLIDWLGARHRATRAQA
jgi:hypothetical protein